MRIQTVYSSLARWAVVAALVAVSAAVDAQSNKVYKWVDENGKVHYGHSVPPQYKDLAHEELNDDGAVVDRTERTLTPEERRERRQQEAEERRLQAELEVREKKDRLLLAAYRSEDDIRKVMNGELSVLLEQQELLNSSIRDQRSSLRDLTAQAADFERVGQMVPTSVTTPIGSIQQVIVRQLAQVGRLQEQIAVSREGYERDILRFRELVQEYNQAL